MGVRHAVQTEARTHDRAQDTGLDRGRDGVEVIGAGIVAEGTQPPGTANPATAAGDVGVAFGILMAVNAQSVLGCGSLSGPR